MKVTIPDNLKEGMPQTTFGKILTATPVVMAVVATMLAGLASSEMTRAQYDRSLAAQQQSKAGDQWSFFQAKRLRGAYQRNTADLMQSLTEVHAIDPSSLKALAQQASDSGNPEIAKQKSELTTVLDSKSGQEAAALLQKGSLPALPPAPAIPENIKKALDAVENLQPDDEVAAALSNVKDTDLNKALRAARDQAQALDDVTAPINKAVDQLERASLLLSPAGAKSSGGPSVGRDLTAARLNYTAMRYETEARLNQSIANLYELQVRKSNFSAERHHRRSQKFFFGMLGAQLAVIISTFAMAARNRNLLWSLAALAGILAVVFAVIVYLTM